MVSTQWHPFAYKEYRHFHRSVVYWGTIALLVEYGLIVLLDTPFHQLPFSLLGPIVGTVGLRGIIYYDKRNQHSSLRLGFSWHTRD
jgi:hypothetical protein